jgi:hypothetical protein
VNQTFLKGLVAQMKGMKDKITGMERTRSGMKVRQDYSYNFVVLGSFAWR